MRDTCVLITTFLRDDMLFRCVESIRKHYPKIKIFVGDNGRPSGEKTEFLARHKCEHLLVTFDCGVSGVRNESLALIPAAYKFIFIVEDDVVFTAATQLAKLYKVLKAEPQVGIASIMLHHPDGKEQHYEGRHWFDVEKRTKYVRKLAEPIDWQDAGGVRYCFCDLALNVFLMRRATWDAVKWDAKFKTALEHADFFCSLKYKLVHGKPVERKKPWRVVYVPEVEAIHAFGLETDEYHKYRRRTVGFQLFAEKWGIKYSDSEFNGKILDLETYGKPKEPVDNFDTPKDKILTDAAETLEKLGLKWWLNSGSCLGAIREKGFIGHDTDLDFGIAPGQDDRWNEIQDAFLCKGFTLYRAWIYRDIKAELSFKRDDIKVDLFFYRDYPVPGDGKVWFGAFGPDDLGRWGGFMTFVPRVYPAHLFDAPAVMYLRGQKCYVPNPAEEYLVCQYGADWKTPIKNWRYWVDNRAIDRKFLDVIDREIARPTAPANARAGAKAGHIGPAIGHDSDGSTLAIGIKTFMRAPLLYRTLAAIEKHAPRPYRLYVADDGPIDDAKRWRYQEMEKAGHKIIRLPFNSGISVGRNAIVSALSDEQYVLIQDDDIAPADGACIANLRAVLDAAPEIGVCAAVIRGEAGEYFASEGYAKGLKFERDGAVLRRTPTSQALQRVGDDGPIFVMADQVPNFFLARREVLAAVPWDDKIKVEFEHLDWFLSLQKYGKWKAAVCLDAMATHWNGSPERDYFVYRRTSSPAHLYQKWGLATITHQF